MSKKKKNAILITVGLLLLLAVCVAGVYAYAQYTINKPTYEIPEAVPAESAVEIPADDKGKAEYVSGLFASSFSKETNVSEWVNVSLGDDITSDLSDKDFALAKLSLENAKNEIQGKYETYDKKPGEDFKEIPSLSIENLALTSCSMEKGCTNDDGEIENEDYYYFSFTQDPADENNVEKVVDLTPDTVNFEAAIEELSESADITKVEKTLSSFTVSGRIDRVYNQIDYVDIESVYTVSLGLDFKGNYEALGEKQLTFSYTVKTTYDVTTYGARFTEDAVYMNPGDSDTLPASAVVADDAEQSEFTLTFVSSDENIATVDDEGIVTAVAASDEPAVITMTLKYKGFTYTDTINVVVTDLEVEDDG